MAGRSIKTTVELDGEAKYKQSLDSINRALRVSSSEMGAVTSAYDKNNASVDDLTKKGDVLAKQIEQQTQKQQILNAAITDAKAAYDAAVKKAAEMAAEYGENSKQAQDAAKAVADAEKAVNGYEIQANNATKTLNNMKRQQDENNKAIDELNNKNTNGLASKFEKLSENAKKFGSVAAAAAKAAAGAIAAATGAVVGFAKSAVDAGMTFDTSMSQVAATMGTTVDQIGELRDFAQEMGSKTAFSASQAADALNYMALAGYDANQSMDMLPKVLNLAAAGGMELAKASDMITDSQSALGLTSEQTAVMVDQMAAAASKTNTSVTQLGDAILTVGGTAKSLSGGTSELSAVLGVMADNGIKGSEAGTHLRNIMLAMTPTTEDAAAAFEKLGIKAYDEQGNLRNLETIFMELSKSMEGMTDEEKTNALNAIFNKTDLTAVNALLSTTAERWNEVNTALDNSSGAAEAMANTQLDNLTGDITLFKSALEGAQIVVSDQLTPTLREFVQFGTDGVSQLTEAFKSGGLSGAMEVLGNLLSEILEKIVGMLPEMLNAGAALLSTLVQGIMDNIPMILETAMNMVLTIAEGIASSLPELIPVIIDVILTVVDNLIANIPMLIDAALAIIVGLADGLIGALPQLVERIPEIITAIVNALISSIPLIIDAAVQLLVAMTEALPYALPAIVGMTPQIIDAIINAFMETDWIDLGVSIITSIGEGLKAGVANIGGMIKDTADSIWNGIKGALGLGNDTKSAANTGKELAQVVTKGFIGTMQENTAEVAAVMPYAKAAAESETYTKEITEQEEQVAAAYVSTANTAENSAKKQTAATKTKTNNILSEAKKAYDKVLSMYKDGKISSEEYNKQYAAILKKYSSEQVSITEYAQEKMTDVAEKEAEKRVSTLKKSIETEISEYQKEFDSIQKQMESFSGKLTKAYKDVYTFTTDEKTGKISAKTTDVMIKSKKELEKYLSDIEALQKRGVSNVMLQQLSEMSKDEGAAVAEYWMSLTDQQLKNLQSNWTAYNNVSAKISQALYADEAKTAAEGMLNAIGETLSENESNLQDSGLMILQGLKQGILNDKGINEIKNLCDGIVNAMTGYFNANAVDVSIGAKIMNGNIVSTSSGAGTGGSAGTTYNFTQNNYSPKALSRDEINRDTQRQLQLAGMK